MDESEESANDRECSKKNVNDYLRFQSSNVEPLKTFETSTTSLCDCPYEGNVVIL